MIFSSLFNIIRNSIHPLIHYLTSQIIRNNRIDHPEKRFRNLLVRHRNDFGQKTGCRGNFLCHAGYASPSHRLRKFFISRLLQHSLTDLVGQSRPVIGCQAHSRLGRFLFTDINRDAPATPPNTLLYFSLA